MTSSSSAVAAWLVPDLRGPGAPEVPEGPSPAEDAYREGFAAGREAGREEAVAAVGEALQALAGAAQSLQAMRAALAGEMEENLYALAVAVARQVVEREVALDPAVVRELVRRALDVLPLDGALEVRLHPADLAALQGQLDVLTAAGRRVDVQWVADAAVDRGGYVIESPQRVVDGRVDPMLLALYERLRHG